MATRERTKRASRKRGEAKGMQRVAAVETPSGPIGPHSGPANRPRIDIEKAQADQDAKVASQTSGDRKLISEETVSRLGKPELYAIAQQRGYELDRLGTRAMRAAFIEAQKKDKLVKKARKV